MRMFRAVNDVLVAVCAEHRAHETPRVRLLPVVRLGVSSSSSSRMLCSQSILVEKTSSPEEQPQLQTRTTLIRAPPTSANIALHHLRRRRRLRRKRKRLRAIWLRGRRGAGQPEPPSAIRGYRRGTKMCGTATCRPRSSGYRR